MHVQAGFAPPRSALDDVVEVLASVRGTVEAEPAKKRWLGGRSSAASAPVLSEIALDLLPVDTMRVPLAGFGNVTADDARRLAAALTAAAAEWPRPQLLFSGGAVLEHQGETSIWVGLAGDLDELSAIARGVTQCVERLGFYVDRRKFDALLKVATVRSDSAGKDLQETAVSALYSLRGRAWTLDAVALFSTSFAGSPPQWREFAQVPLRATSDSSHE